MIRIVVVCCCILMGCGKQEIADSYTKVELKSALAHDEQLTLRFSAPEDGKFNLQMKVGHDDDYRYENVYLKYTLISDRDTLAQDVKSFALMDNGGLWKGDKTSAGFQVEETLQSLNLSSKKDYELKVEQYSRDNPLDGVNMIAVRVLPI